MNIPRKPHLSDADIKEIINKKRRQKEINMNHAVKFGIVGLGQAGGRLADEFHALGYPTVLVNTSSQDINPMKCPNKVIIGQGGAGRDTKAGDAAVTKHKDKIIAEVHKIFDNVERVLVVAGSSGGTGGGGVAALVDVLTDQLQYPVGVLTTLPLKSEDARSKKNTISVLRALTKKAIEGKLAPYILMDNEKIIQNYPNLSTLEFWNKANDEVVKIFNLFNVLSARNSAYTSFDPADYKKVLSSGGLMIFGAMNVGNATDEDSLSHALAENLQTGLLAGGFNLVEATHAGLLIVGGNELLSKMPRVAEEKAFSTMNRMMGNSGTVFKGVYNSDKLQHIEVLTMISGLNLPTARIRELVEESNKHDVHFEKKAALKDVDDILAEFGDAVPESKVKESTEEKKDGQEKK